MLNLRHKSAKERIDALTSYLNDEELSLLESTHFDGLTLANTLIENAVGYYSMPFALAPGFTINHKTYPVIPLAIEETSVVAGLSKNTRFVNMHGTVSASSAGETHIGQIHCPHLNNPLNFEETILAHKENLIRQANQVPCASMVQRGGGVRNIEIRLIQRPDGHYMGILHVLIDTKDAMGANIINQTCEYLKPIIEEITQEKVLMCILSNLNTEKLTEIEICLENVDEDLANRLSEASLIAQLDPFRAVTHNKGIMNGIDAICLATGNDWRAVEASLHGFASRDGQYRGLSQWSAQENSLIGTLKAPINVGIIGGVTRNHPLAALSLRLLNVTSATELAYVVGTVGLIQNLAALRALVTDGIVRGHMGLHLTNLIHQTNATTSEQEYLLTCTRNHLQSKKYITLTDVQNYLDQFRELKED